MNSSAVSFPIQNQWILADAHVHIYPCFDLSSFLESAFLNFKTAAEVGGYPDRWVGLLFLTEARHDNVFKELYEISNSPSNAIEGLHPWKILKTQEDRSLYAQSSEGRGIYLIAGHQIVTAENLEVLALATREKIQEGMPLEVTVREVMNQGGIPVVPWGFGKWFGRRGKHLDHLLNSQKQPTLFLGDNSGRPTFWSEPPLFKKAITRGMRILPGSDPLPFASQVSRAGKFGFALAGTLDPTQPAASIQTLLQQPDTPIAPYGALENPWQFIQNQIGMQMSKKKRQNPK